MSFPAVTLLLACLRHPPVPGADYMPPPSDAVPPSMTNQNTPSPCDVDGDGDGVDACDDCDDNDATTFPGAEERCDGRDNDCDGAPLPEEAELACVPCDDAGWWNATRGLTGDSLIDELHGLTEPQACFDYGAATNFLFLELDADGSEVECVYTGLRYSIANGEPDPADMNTEHTWPQSIGAGSLPARCDLHHLFPTNAVANSQRSNHPFGEVSVDTASIEGLARLGNDAQGKLVFEPPDAHKGNVARAMLYFATRYGHTLSNDETSLYQAWSTLDPVDDAEMDRTWMIADEQGVANPYVVCPWLPAELTP